MSNKKEEITPPEEEMKTEEINTDEPAELEPALEDFKFKYLHLLADSENARKRMHKDRDEIVQYSIRSLLLDFIQPIDHMENALKFTDQSSDEVQNWAKGFKMILTQFKDVLVNNGVKTIDSIGKPFDPHMHEAIEMLETSDFPPDTVVEENVKGYMIGEKTLRPARVKVSKEPESKEVEKEEKVK